MVLGKKRSLAEANGRSKNVGTKTKPHFSHKTAPKPQLKVEARSDWHASDLPGFPEAKGKATPSLETAGKLHDYAATLLDAENKAYTAANESRSSSRFASTIMSAGTLEDKISALTLLVQEAPLHGMKAFENLLGLARKRSREQALMAAVAVKDLLGQGSILPDRKLRQFEKQPGLIAALQGPGSTWWPGRPLPGGLHDSHLITWAFEDWLKKQYFEFLKVLENWCSDEVEYARSRAITYVWELLRDKPEQEENLLRLLVNKLGDTDRKIASRTSYLLLQLQVTHPAMKRVIIDAIENECLFRPSQSLHAKYYSIITLNQTVLGKADQEIASELLRIYFSMFLQLLKPADPAVKAMKNGGRQQGGGGKPGKKAAQKAKANERAEASESETREKMAAQVLTGVNRAFPFADTDSTGFTEQIDTIFRVTHSANFNTSIQALMLLQKLTSRKHHGVDRYYRTLYESLSDPRLITSSKQIMYLNLLYRSLKSDMNIRRVQAFVKRLLQIINLHDVPFICGVVYLISELEVTFPSIRSMILETEPDLDDEEEHFIDAPEEQEDPQVQIPVTASTDSEVKQKYDPRKREPEHSNADKSALWDILPLLAHFHPSVALFAECILEAKAMPPKPDPNSHTMMHFLDRFIYRGVRTKQGATRGSSIMQPLSGSAAADLLIKARDLSKVPTPLNAESFRVRDVKDVAADEVFFHSYFNQASKGRAQSKKKKSKTADADGSDPEDSGEDEIWKALVDSRPEIDGPDDDDDLSMGDLESAYSDSDAEAGLGDVDMDGGVEIADFPEDEKMDDLGEDNESGEDELNFDEEDALLGDDADLPSDLEAKDTLAAQVDMKKDGRKDSRGSKKRKLKHLPTFASIDDYAKLLENEPDDY